MLSINFACMYNFTCAMVVMLHCVICVAKKSRIRIAQQNSNNDNIMVYVIVVVSTTMSPLPYLQNHKTWNFPCIIIISNHSRHYLVCSKFSDCKYMILVITRSVGASMNRCSNWNGAHSVLITVQVAMILSSNGKAFSTDTIQFPFLRSIHVGD